jgi:glycosyltransferase involved in cell wall biosynthesis
VRILVLTNLYPPHHFGGYEISCEDAVSFFRAKGHDVLVLTSDTIVPGVEPASESDSEVRRELRMYWADQRMLRPSLRESLAIERTNQAALARAIADHRPDVVSAWHMGALSMGLLTTCRRRDIPLVHVIHDDWLTYGPTVDRWWHVCRRARIGALIEPLVKVPCRASDLGSGGAFCFISATTRRVAETEGGWQFPVATVGYCGVDVDTFPIGRVPPRPSWSGRLLYVGRIDSRKGIDTAIRALPLLPPETTLVVDGRGDESHLAELRRLAHDSGVGERVSFRVSKRAELADTYASADALLFLPKWDEPFGLVPLEAMACSTPVVTTGTGGSGEFLIDGANCLRVPVDDPRSVADAVGQLAADAELRARLVADGLATAEELSLPRWTALLEAWHLAAADDFAGGQPADREPISAILRPRLSAK